MKKIVMFVLLIVCLVSFGLAVPPPNNGNSGAIWTTNGDCGDETQDANHYGIGDSIYINGKNFDADIYKWDITGQPGQASCDPNIAVANGSQIVDSSGEFCFMGYIVQNDDCGEYKANFGNKQDNYRVDENQIPEFSVIAAGVAIMGAIGVYAYTRRK